jgi:hypothetical protein
LIFFALSANFRVDSVSFMAFQFGFRVQTITVLEFPPSESFSKWVSFDSL